MQALSKLAIWNTGIDEAGVSELKKINPVLEMELGYRNDTTRIQLNPPRMPNKVDPGSLVFVGQNLSLHLEHPIKGVQIRYSKDNQRPDSLKSPLFNQDTVFTENTIVQARAFKEGWLGSDSLKIQFLRSTIKPDSSYLLSNPNEKYLGAGSATFTNHMTGDFDLNTEKWIAFREKDMEVLFEFKKPATISKLGLRFMLNTGPWIFPPESLELWGGDDKNDLKLLFATKPSQPKKGDRAKIDLVEVSFKPTSVTYLKIKARPVKKLPSWHKEKGKPAWLFVDEVLLN